MAADDGVAYHYENTGVQVPPPRKWLGVLGRAKRHPQAVAYQYENTVTGP